MALILYYHPFSSYCQKALMALYEKELDFSPYLIDLSDERQRAEFATIWPHAKFPVLHDIDAGVTLPEASLIVQYADGLGQAGPRLVPIDAAAARNVHLFDRLLDNYLHAPLQKIVSDRLRPEGSSDPFGVAEARATIDTTCRLLESRLTSSGWITGPDFTLADCAAAPPLFYLSRLVAVNAYPRLAAYLQRVMQRPSFWRCIEDARRYRPLFPATPGDRDWPDAEARATF